MTNRTNLENEIIEYASANPEATGKEIASEVNCSQSYANETRKKYRDAIIGENDISEVNRTVSFAHPYEVLASDDFISQYDLSDVSIVELKVERGNDTRSVKAPLKKISTLREENELHSYVYGISELSPDVPEYIKSEMPQFFDEKSDQDISIYTPDAFEDFVEENLGLINKYHREADLIVGVGLIEIGIEHDPEPSSQIQMPDFSIPANNLSEIFSEDRPRVLDISEYTGELTYPKEVYFNKAFDLSVDNEDRVKKRVKEQRFFDLGINSRISSLGFITGPSTFEAKDGVVDIKESEIKIQGLRARVLFLFEKDITFDDLVHIIEDNEFTIEFSGGVKEIEKEIDRSRRRIGLKINSVSININYDSDAIPISYPKHIQPIEDIVNEIIEFIREKVGERVQSTEPIDLLGELTPQSESWLFDTNAIYHQIVDDDASSILKTVLPNRQLYKKRIVIPWPVIYEINKHKDSTDSGPPPAVQEIGVDNLRTLKKLHKNGFIDLNVDPIPEKIQTKVSESHIADLHVLQRSQVTDSVLISGDKRLRRLAEISDSSVVDIREIAEVEDIPDLTSEIWEKVHNKIGTEIKEKEEIIDEVRDKQSEVLESLERNMQSLGEAPRPDPEVYLTQWVEEGRIIEYGKELEDGEENQLLYDKAIKQDIVITPSVATELINHIIEVDGEPYLTETILNKLANILNLPGPGLPLITFHVPISNVIGPQSTSLGGMSTEARHFYQINDLENANYDVGELEESISGREKIQDSVQLAHEKQYTILCTEVDQYIDPIGGLLGIDVKKLDI